MKNYPLVMIDWIDAQSACEWEDMGRVKEWIAQDSIVHEVGWVVLENDQYLILVNQVGDVDFGNRTKIPKLWIVKRTKLCQNSRSK